MIFFIQYGATFFDMVSVKLLKNILNLQFELLINNTKINKKK